MKSKYFVLTLMALMAIVLATTIQIVADVAASEAVPEMIGANMIGAESADIAAAQTVTPTGVITEGETLKIVKERGTLKCGVNAGVPGFGFLDSETNEFSGFDVDTCRAVAAAVLGDAEAVEFRPATGQDRFVLLQTGEIDMLSRNTTWTFIRDTELGLNFAPTTFYDGQGLMVTEESGIETIENMEGTTVCVQQGTTTEANLADVMRIQGIDYEPVVFEDAPKTLAAYSEGRCDVITADRSALVTERLQLANPEDHLILDEVISKEPLGPLVRHGDDQWFDIVKWTVFATIAAEEYGVTSENVEEMAQTSENPEIRRLLGAEGELGQKLGLENDWAVKVIAQVGNYGEIYDRHLGPDTPINLARGLNVLYTEGGLLYAPPFR
jgi:general L-amino acid transport system substrate-binding protein